MTPIALKDGDSNDCLIMIKNNYLLTYSYKSFTSKKQVKTLSNHFFDRTVA
jgi:hypothetical protein